LHELVDPAVEVLLVDEVSRRDHRIDGRVGFALRVDDRPRRVAVEQPRGVDTKDVRSSQRELLGYARAAQLDALD
jgi:hypothetical protein